MSDNEIMAAIGSEAHYLHERPPLGSARKSLLQKLNERNQSFVQQMRSKREGFNRRESREAVRSPTPSTKGFFGAAPVAWTPKTERSPTELALCYDDLPTNQPPAPTTSKPLPPAPDDTFKDDDDSSSRRPSQGSTTESYRQSSTDIVPARKSSVRRVDSSHSMISNGTYKPCTSRTASYAPSVDRPRSSPSEMSDQELDDWLEKPIDADLHRERKLSAAGSATTSQTSSSEELSLPKPDKRMSTLSKRGASWMDDWFSDSHETDVEADDVVDEDLKAWQISSTFLKTSRRNVVVIAHRALTLDSLPDEVLQGVSRHLDDTSARQFRHTCKKFNQAIPAQLGPVKEE